jgi:hypothetical protein
MSRYRSAHTSKFKSTKLSVDKLEARMLCAVDTSIGNLEAVIDAPLVAAASNKATALGSTPAIASRARVVGSVNSIVTSANLTVLGKDNGGESGLTYTWSVVNAPSESSATFSVNDSNAAKSTTINFDRAGNYDVRVTITDAGGLSVASNLRISVKQKLTSISLTPDTASVSTNATQQFIAQGLDQFEQAMTKTPRFTWSTTSGRITNTGLYTAPTAAGSATVTARSGAISTTAVVTIASATDNNNSSGGGTSSNNGAPVSSLTNTSIRNSVTGYLSDSSISRTEMIALLRSAGNDGSIDASELADLRFVVSNASSFGVAEYVKVLASNVVNSNAANARYQGANLGNLAAGSSQTTLNNLVNKWFLGTDVPTLTSSSLQYRTTSGVLFGGNPSTSNMKQGAVGDCYFIAALGAIADRNPDAIRNMFIDNGDGTFTVRFFFGSYAMFYNSDGSISTGFGSGTTSMEDYVTVNRSLATYASGALAYSGNGWSSSNTANVLWIALAEKAYAQWNESGRADRSTAANSYSSIAGGWMGEVSAQVLGYNATDYVLSNSQQSHLTNALASNRAVTIGTKSGTTLGGLVGGHAYVVAGYNSSNNTFTLLNPWGNTNPRALTWAELQTACDWFSVANPSSSTPIAQTVRTGSVRSEGAEAMGTPVILMVEVTLTSKTTTTDFDTASSSSEDSAFTQLFAEEGFAEASEQLAEAIVGSSDAEDALDEIDFLLAVYDAEESCELAIVA